MKPYASLCLPIVTFSLRLSSRSDASAKDLALKLDLSVIITLRGKPLLLFTFPRTTIEARVTFGRQEKLTKQVS